MTHLLFFHFVLLHELWTVFESFVNLVNSSYIVEVFC